MMLSNNTVAGTVENVTGGILETFRCMIFGKCTVREYEYTFYLNGEELKADDCFSSFYGRSSCELNGITYNNVDYSSKFIREYEEQSDFVLYPYMLIFVVCYIIFKFFIDFRKNILFSERI